MLDWIDDGQAYEAKMIAAAQALAEALQAEGLVLLATSQGAPRSHNFVVEVAAFGGGQAASK
ncbi:MAG: hypothetical protein AB8B60_16615 [Sulfitobacter sp.]